MAHTPEITVLGAGGRFDLAWRCAVRTLAGSLETGMHARLVHLEADPRVEGAADTIILALDDVLQVRQLARMCAPEVRWTCLRDPRGAAGCLIEDGTPFAWQGAWWDELRGEVVHHDPATGAAERFPIPKDDPDASHPVRIRAWMAAVCALRTLGANAEDLRRSLERQARPQPPLVTFLMPAHSASALERSL